MAIAVDKLKALGKIKGAEPAPKMVAMGKPAKEPPMAKADKPSDMIKALTKHAPTIEKALEDKAEGKFSIKDKPSSQDVALAQSVYEALPSAVKSALNPLADVSLARAIVLADELADAGTIDDPEPMTAFLFLVGQIVPSANEAEAEEA